MGPDCQIKLEQGGATCIFVGIWVEKEGSLGWFCQKKKGDFVQVWDLKIASYLSFAGRNTSQGEADRSREGSPPFQGLQTESSPKALGFPSFDREIWKMSISERNKEEIIVLTRKKFSSKKSN